MVQNFGASAGEGETAVVQPVEGPLPAAAGVLGVPQNVADLVVFLASDESAFITAQEFVIDGGMSMLPASLFHELQ